MINKNYRIPPADTLFPLDKTLKTRYNENKVPQKNIFSNDILAKSALDYLYSKSNRDKTKNFLANNGLPSFEDREYNKRYYGEQEENKRILNLFKEKTNGILNPKLPNDTDRAFLSGFIGKEEEENNYKKKIANSTRALGELQDVFRGSQFERELNPTVQRLDSAPAITNAVNRNPNAKNEIKHAVADPVSDIKPVYLKTNKETGLDELSDFLTAASLIPGADTVTNLIAIPVDLARGDMLSAGLDLLGTLPFVGEIADSAKLAKAADRAVDAVKASNKAADIISIAHIPPANLVPTHTLTLSKKQYAELMESIKKNGITESIKYVEHNGKKYVVDGHHRLSAAKQLKLNKIPAEKVSLPYKGYKTIKDLLWFD